MSDLSNEYGSCKRIPETQMVEYRAQAGIASPYLHLCKADTFKLIWQTASVVLNLWVMSPLGGDRISDIYIPIHNSSKICYEVAMK